MATIQLRGTRFLDIGGALVIVSSGYALFNSFLNLSNITSSIGTPWSYEYEPLFGWLIIINAFVFPLGLTGGILTLLRKHFITATIGMVIMLFSHILSAMLPALKYPYYFLGWNLMWGTPMVVASALGLSFMIVNRKEFT